MAGLSSMVLLFPPLPQLVLWALKIGSALLVVLIAYSVQVWRMFLKGLFWYVFLNITLSGVVFAAMYYGAAGGISVNNLTVYFNVSPIVLIGSVIAVYLLVQVCAYVFGKPQDEAIVPYTASVLDIPLQGMILLDTGFRVKDPISGAPVFLLSVPMVRQQLPPALQQTLDTYFTSGELTQNETVHLRLIPMQLANGYVTLPAIRTQSLTLKGQAKKENMFAAFTCEPLGDGSFSAIVNLQAYQQYG